MADFQQGVIIFVVIKLVSVWGIHAAGGPSGIIGKLEGMDCGGGGRVDLP